MLGTTDIFKYFTVKWLKQSTHHKLKFIFWNIKISLIVRKLFVWPSSYTCPVTDTSVPTFDIHTNYHIYVHSEPSTCIQILDVPEAVQIKKYSHLWVHVVLFEWVKLGCADSNQVVLNQTRQSWIKSVKLGSPGSN